jgi:hypothetical protein
MRLLVYELKERCFMGIDDGSEFKSAEEEAAAKEFVAESSKVTEQNSAVLKLQKDVISAISAMHYDVIKSEPVQDDGAPAMAIVFDTYAYGKQRLIIRSDGGVTLPVNLRYKDYDRTKDKKEVALKEFFESPVANRLMDIQKRVQETNPGLVIQVRDEDGETHTLTYSEPKLEDDEPTDTPPGGVPVNQQRMDYNAQGGYWQGTPKQ